MKITIASRASKLAMWQSEYIQDCLKAQYNCTAKINQYSTKGDEILDRSLAAIGGKGLFTKELENAMLEGDADIAVHSLKDIPVDLPSPFILGAITKRADVRDMFLSEKYISLEQLPKNAVVGTTSLRRKFQLLNFRPDLIIKDLRGNINTRLQKLKDNQYDAIILASAGVHRLDLTSSVKHTHSIDKNIIIPAMGQAALAIECLEAQKDNVKFLEDNSAYIETTIERDFVRILDGGCQAPIGVNATIDGKNIKVIAIVGGIKSLKIIKHEITCSKDYYNNIGKNIAQLFISLGALELLNERET